jgi:hypothetical protein
MSLNLDGSVAVDSSGNCFIAGQFSDTAFFDQIVLTSEGQKDIYITKCGSFNDGIKEKQTESQLLIYANPNEGKCSITLPEDFRHEQHLTISIYNNQGKLVQQSPVEIIGDRVSLIISAEAKGMYTAVLTNGKKNYTGKIVFK